jgi:hypothetical protein
VSKNIFDVWWVLFILFAMSAGLVLVAAWDALMLFTDAARVTPRKKETAQLLTRWWHYLVLIIPSAIVGAVLVLLGWRKDISDFTASFFAENYGLVAEFIMLIVIVGGLQMYLDRRHRRLLLRSVLVRMRSRIIHWSGVLARSLNERLSSPLPVPAAGPVPPPTSMAVFDAVIQGNLTAAPWNTKDGNEKSQEAVDRAGEWLEDLPPELEWREQLEAVRTDLISLRVAADAVEGTDPNQQIIDLAGVGKAAIVVANSAESAIRVLHYRRALRRSPLW